MPLYDAVTVRMIGRAHHFGTNVSNLDRSLAFYRDGLGLDVDREFHIEGVQGRLDGIPDPDRTDADVSYLVLDGFYFELVEFHHPVSGDGNSSMANNDIGKTHFCFEVVDADAVYDELSAVVDFIHPPLDVTTNSRVVKGYDPDRNLVEFWEQPGDHWADRDPADVVCAHHYGVNVADLERSLEFYRDTLGMTVTNRFVSSTAQAKIDDLDVEDTDSEIVFLDAGGKQLEVVDYAYPESADANREMTNYDIGRSHFGIRVDDIDAVYEEYAEEIPFVSEPQRAASGTEIVKCHDPDGNVVEFIEPAED